MNLAALTKELNARELQILELIADAKTGPEISEILSLAPPTVKVYTSRVLEKLDARNRTQAAVAYWKARVADLQAPPNPISVTFSEPMLDRTELERLSPHTRARIASACVSEGASTIDRARAILGLPPIPDGEGNVRYEPLCRGGLD